MKKYLKIGVALLLILLGMQASYASKGECEVDEEYGELTCYDGTGTWYTGKDAEQFAKKIAVATKKHPVLVQEKQKAQEQEIWVDDKKEERGYTYVPQKKERWYTPKQKQEITSVQPRQFSFMRYIRQALNSPKTYPGTRHILKKLERLIQRNRYALDEQKLYATNRFFNREIRHVPDWKIFHRRDYWATPIQTIKNKKGDCEDFAIAKYYTLRAMGVPKDRLSIAYGKRKSFRGEAHMVVVYYPYDKIEPLVLDNLTNWIKTASRSSIRSTVYEFNEDSIWAIRKSYEDIPSGDANRMISWRKVKERMARGG